MKKIIVKILSYTIMAAGSISFAFFLYYNGTLIPHSTLFTIVSFIVIFIGVLIPTFFSTKNKSLLVNQSKSFDKLKANGEKIILDFNNCEFKENNYYEQPEKETYTRYEMIDASFDSNRNYKEIYTEQSVLIYNNKNGDRSEKFTSQTFPFNADTLKSYVLNNSITLLVDRFDRTNYLFELLS